MFIEPFSVDDSTKLETLKVDDECDVVTARLRGTGLRPNAEISVNGKAATSKHQESTHSYVFTFDNHPPANSWAVHYQQNNLQGYEEKDFEQAVARKFEAKLRHYSSGSPAEADLTFAIPGQDPSKVEISMDDPQVEFVPGKSGCERPKLDLNGTLRVKCFVPGRKGKKSKSERDSISLKVAFTDGGKPRFVDIPLPVRPQILSLKNLRTQAAHGFATEDATVIIKGLNLQQVTSVLFGDQEAKITAIGDLDGVTVKVPKAEVSKGQKSAVPVLLRTSAGTFFAGTYTYEGEPLPKVAAAS